MKFKVYSVSGTLLDGTRDERPEWIIPVEYVEINSVEELLSFYDKHCDLIISREDDVPTICIYDDYIE